jgi:ribose/xylose/arabinose/galactoside ABC-type transport system permease subunit
MNASASFRTGLGLASRFAAHVGVLLLLLVAAVSVQSFFKAANIDDVAKQASILGLVGIGQTLVLLVRGLDLSVGAVMGLAAIIVADGSHGGSIVGAFLLALVVGAAVGLVNGGLVTKRAVPPFVATLGMLILLQGARLAYTKGEASGTVSEALRRLTVDSLFGIPYPVLIWLGLNVLFAVLLYATPYGRQVYAVGLNPEVARLSGVRVDLITASAYVASSLLCVIAGVLLASYVGYVDQYVGSGTDLDSIAAALIGGTSFAGGRGGLGGTIAGVLLITLILNLVTVAGLSVQLQYVIKGAVLVAAVALQGVRLRTATADTRAAAA